MSFIPAADIPPWAFGLLAASLVGWVLWQYVIKRGITRSRIRRDIDQLLAERSLENGEGGKSLEVQLLAAGIDLGEGAETKFRLLSLGLAVVTAVLVLVFNLPTLLAFALGAAAYFAPGYWLNNRESARARAIDNDMPAAYTRIASILTTQPNIAEMLNEVAETLSVVDPGNDLALELRRTAMDAKARGTQTALKALEQRAPTQSLASLALQLQIFEETGGQFVEGLIASAERSRTIISGRNKAKSKAGEAMLAVKVLPALLVFVSMGMSKDPEFGRFYSSTLGQIVMVGVGVVMFFGYTMAKSIVDEIG